MNILSLIFGWLNDQILKMTWLSELVRLLVEKVFRLSVNGRLGGSIHFFIYDTIKIFILLSLLFLLYPISRVISRQKGQRRFLGG
jgi:hypothetical protein